MRGFIFGFSMGFLSMTSLVIMVLGTYTNLSAAVFAGVVFIITWTTIIYRILKEIKHGDYQGRTPEPDPSLNSLQTVYRRIFRRGTKRI